MRITAGTLKGRTLHAPVGMGTRPTADRVREALFNILTHHDWGDLGDPLDGTTVIDAFAGTGALGIEALSRGAAQAIFVEKDNKAFDVLKHNITSLDLQTRATFLCADVTRSLGRIEKKVPCGLVFLDPPYHKNLVIPAITSLRAAGLVSQKALWVIETAKGEATGSIEDTLKLLLKRDYGDTTIGYYTDGG